MTAAALAVVAWRVGAFVRPSSLVTVPPGLHLPMTLLGVLFLVCGVATWWLRPDRWTAVFLVYGLGGGVHWGGAVGAGEPGLDRVVLFAYLAASAAAEAALLHLALVYRASGPPLAGALRIALYAPAALALGIAPVAGLLSPSVLQTTAGLVLLAANLLAWTGGIVFVVRLVRADAATRRAGRLPLVVSGLIVGGIVPLVGSTGVFPGNPEAWNLAAAAVPLCLAFALASGAPAASMRG